MPVDHERGDLAVQVVRVLPRALVGDAFAGLDAVHEAAVLLTDRPQAGTVVVDPPARTVVGGIEPVARHAVLLHGLRRDGAGRQDGQARQERDPRARDTPQRAADVLDFHNILPAPAGPSDPCGKHLCARGEGRESMMALSGCVD